MKCALLLVALSLVLASCSSPPKPPLVDVSRKHPVNAAVAVKLQVCSSELQNMRILADENGRAARNCAAAQRTALQQKSESAARNTVYEILFDFGSTRVAVPDADAARMATDARAAPLILLRGRTDGDTENAADSRIARERADAVRVYLVQAGVEPSRIRVTYQPVGDHAADNVSAGGRALNRRVEVEIYRFAPRIATLGEFSGS
jgi:outer membrane protein OmpA-like peptidoglycan-associated protein